jgi:large exoprotein involved in heme utilization and adhesion
VTLVSGAAVVVQATFQLLIGGRLGAATRLQVLRRATGAIGVNQTGPLLRCRSSPVGDLLVEEQRKNSGAAAPKPWHHSYGRASVASPKNA